MGTQREAGRRGHYQTPWLELGPFVSTPPTGFPGSAQRDLPLSPQPQLCGFLAPVRQAPEQTSFRREVAVLVLKWSGQSQPYLWQSRVG